ncbi:hypothetical protein ACFQ6S_41665 [Streptomyces sp. NPDC056479]
MDVAAGVEYALRSGPTVRAARTVMIALAAVTIVAAAVSVVLPA